jgi:hypothetical protein
MRGRHGISVAAVGIAALSLLAPGEAAAQAVPPAAQRDAGWGAVSDVSLAISAVSLALTPRVYYSDPISTVGWKGRYHVSILAPMMTMVAMSWLFDQPLKSAFQDPRPGCTLEQTNAQMSGCESFGLVSTHGMATASFAGVGLGVWLIDTFKYSDGRVHPANLIGNVVLPLSATVVGSVARGFENDGTVRGFEKPEQILAGAIPGFVIGTITGLVYSSLQRPSCPYGDSLFCW